MRRARLKNNPIHKASRAKFLKLMLLASAAVCYSFSIASFDRASAQSDVKSSPPRKFNTTT